MTDIECCNCAIIFGVPDRWQKHRTQDKQQFFCPNGHPQSYSESVLDKVRRERDRAVQEQTRLAEENQAKEKEIKKLKKRASAGTCPCCTRTFSNMARHMKTKHPEMLASNVVKMKAAK